MCIRDSYYINHAGVDTSNQDFINSYLSRGVVYGLSHFAAANSIPITAELKRGDIVNIWKKTPSGWINSSALIDSLVNRESGEYTLIGPSYWQTLAEPDRGIVSQYITRIENSSDISFSVCRLHSSFNAYLWRLSLQ